MSVKSIGPCALVLIVLGVGALRAQDPALPYSGPSTPSEAGSITPTGATGMPTAMPTQVGLSNWITYARPGCCGPIGGNGPIGTEAYFRVGPSFPVEGAFFGHTLEPGLEIQGGGRLLFFNTEVDKAWTVDLSLSDIGNHGQHSDLKATLEGVFVMNPVTGTTNPIRIPQLPVSVRNLHRTTVNAGLGREWYLHGSADCDGNMWRVGIDSGGRYGSAKINLKEITHRTDTIGGTFIALHSDVEIPRGCCIFTLGVRLEWDYTWTDILQRQNDTDVMDMNLLFTAGLRF